ncbi:MAG: PQQ-binding-like beta-propeller repeat protein [Chloroflexota bacterium]
MIKNFIAILAVSILCQGINAQDWPQYLGQDRNSTSPQKGILRSWPAQGPEVVWSANVGIGFGGPVVKDGKVYLLDRDDKAGDKLRCFDMNNGKELWSFSYEAPGSVMFPGSRSVPAIDGNRIYSVGPYGQFYCVDINTHKPVWNKNIWSDYGGGEIPRWAVTQCPLIYGDLVIVAPQAPQAGVVAFEKLTGKVKWTTPSLGATGYVSPALLKVGNENHIVMITASQGRGSSASGGKVVGIEPLSGKVLWEYSNFQCGIPVPSAVDAGEGRALISGGYEAGTCLIKITKKADGAYNVAELFKTKEFGAHTQPPVLANGNFYAQYSTNERKDGLVCMGMDGTIKWKTMRNPLFDKGGMIFADGLLIMTDGMKKLYLIEPDAAAFKPVASADLLKTGNATQNWAPLALSNGRLIIRDQERLLCVKIVK